MADAEAKIRVFLNDDQMHHIGYSLGRPGSMLLRNASDVVLSPGTIAKVDVAPVSAYEYDFLREFGIFLGLCVALGVLFYCLAGVTILCESVCPCCLAAPAPAARPPESFPLIRRTLNPKTLLYWAKRTVTLALRTPKAASLELLLIPKTLKTEMKLDYPQFFGWPKPVLDFPPFNKSSQLDYLLDPRRNADLPDLTREYF